MHLEVLWKTDQSNLFPKMSTLYKYDTRGIQITTHFLIIMSDCTQKI